MVTPCEAVKTVGVESRRVASARKKAAAYSLKEAMKCIHKDKWLEAMQDELASLTENGVYELISLPVGAAALSGKWVLKIKRGAQAEIEWFKARYVVRGFEQVLGNDFHQTWAPVGHYTTLRCLLVIMGHVELSYLLCLQLKNSRGMAAPKALRRFLYVMHLFT